jgi:hypothetical protein
MKQTLILIAIIALLFGSCNKKSSSSSGSTSSGGSTYKYMLKARFWSQTSIVSQSLSINGIQVNSYNRNGVNSGDHITAGLSQNYYISGGTQNYYQDSTILILNDSIVKINLGYSSNLVSTYVVP